MFLLLVDLVQALHGLESVSRKLVGVSNLSIRIIRARSFVLAHSGNTLILSYLTLLGLLVSTSKLRIGIAGAIILLLLSAILLIAIET